MGTRSVKREDVLEIYVGTFPYKSSCAIFGIILDNHPHSGVGYYVRIFQDDLSVAAGQNWFSVFPGFRSKFQRYSGSCQSFG